MGLLLSYDNDVTGLLARVLISLSVEGVLVIVGRSFVNDGLKNLLLLADFLSIASLALVLFVDNLTLTTAIFTRSLRLCVHAGPEHRHFHYNTTTFARIALLDSAFLATNAVASSTNALSVDSNLGGLAGVNLFESQLNRVHDRFALLGARLLRSSSSTHAEEAAEDVVHATVTTTALLKAVFTVLIVEVTLLLVSQTLVGSLNFLKLLLIAATVWVLLQSLLPVSFLDFIVGSILLDIKQLVELGVVHLLRRSTGMSTHLLCKQRVRDQITKHDKVRNWPPCFLVEAEIFMPVKRPK